jgi:hypothetical protein
MSRPKVKAQTKSFTREPLPEEYRHENYTSIIAKMFNEGICSKNKAQEMLTRVDKLYGEGSE